MAEHNNLVPHPALRAHLERSAGVAGQNDTKRNPRLTAISLFGRGRSVAHPHHDHPATLDRRALAAGDEFPFFNAARVWESLNTLQMAGPELLRNNLFPNPDGTPTTTIFDILRTRVLQGLSDRGWRRVGITSPTPDCGKTYVAANLALSLARRPASRSVLIDMDLRKTDLARSFGQTDVPPLAEFLTGDQPLEAVFCRYGKTLALGLNGAAEPDPGAILHSPDTAAALAAVLSQLEPEVVLLDLPPALGRDDVLALQPQLDALLLVTDGRHSSPADIRACEALFQDRLPILGAVLNRGEDAMPGMGR